MKAKAAMVRLLVAVVLITVPGFNVVGQERQAITRQLVDMVEHSPEIKSLLVKSIEQARQINPDKISNPAQTLEEYYAFIDWAAKAMPWSILRQPTYPKLYDQIDQSLNYFYFINDQPLSELEDKGYFNNSLQYHEPYRTWLIQITKEWGLFLSTPESWNDTYYKAALEDERFGLQRGWYENPSRWKSFNDFFARYLKSPEQRPIAAPGDPAIVVSPADSKPEGVWTIDENSNLVHAEGVAVKSEVFRSVATLVGENSKYRDAFANGTMTHTFLDVYDYHRYHFPIDGTVREVGIILQDNAVGGIVTWDTELNRYMLDDATPGWQNIQTRGCVIVETEHFGVVAILPIGMSQVSSVNFETNVIPGLTVKKGDMLGHFLFGGSDIVMLFQQHVDFKLTVPKDNNGSYTHVWMGGEYGRLSIKP